MGELLVVMLSQTLKVEVRFRTALFMRTSILIKRLISHLGEHFLDGDFQSSCYVRKRLSTMGICEMEEVQRGGVGAVKTCK